MIHDNLSKFIIFTVASTVRIFGRKTAQFPATRCEPALPLISSEKYRAKNSQWAPVV